MKRRVVTVKLTVAELSEVLHALHYYRNDADPSREGDLASVTARQWKTLDRATKKLRTAKRDERCPEYAFAPDTDRGQCVLQRDHTGPHAL